MNNNSTNHELNETSVEQPLFSAGDKVSVRCLGGSYTAIISERHWIVGSQKDICGNELPRQGWLYIFEQPPNPFISAAYEDSIICKLPTMASVVRLPTMANEPVRQTRKAGRYPKSVTLLRRAKDERNDRVARYIVLRRECNTVTESLNLMARAYASTCEELADMEKKLEKARRQL